MHFQCIPLIFTLAHTSSVVRPTYWNLAFVGRSLCTHNSLLVFSSVVELRKSNGGQQRGAEGNTGGSPHPPVILALLFMIMMMGVRQDWSDLLRAAYNRNCATSCVFEVILTCTHIIQCLCDCNVTQLILFWQSYRQNEQSVGELSRQ